jgi:hypothetical protein
MKGPFSAFWLRLKRDAGHHLVSQRAAVGEDGAGHGKVARVNLLNG